MAQIILDSNNNLIQGDFDNATINNRTKFKTTTTNATTNVYAVPNGSATSAGFTVTNAADPTNASKLTIATNGSTDTQIISGVNGSGTYLPLSFYTNNALAAQISTAGVFSATGGVAASSMPAGSIVQVVQTWDNTTATFVRNDYITYLQTSITPSSASNKILVCVNLGCTGADAGADLGIILYRGATQISTGTGASGSNASFIPFMSAGGVNAYSGSFMYLDSPATTSSTTYKLLCSINSPRTMYYNRRGADLSYASASSVILMEVKA